MVWDPCVLYLQTDMMQIFVYFEPDVTEMYTFSLLCVISAWFCAYETKVIL